MKLLSHFFIWMGVAALVLPACERHDFEDTKVLFEGHGEHGHDHEVNEDHSEGKQGEEGKPDASGSEEEKAAKAAEKKAEPRDTGI